MARSRRSGGDLRQIRRPLDQNVAERAVALAFDPVAYRARIQIFGLAIAHLLGRPQHSTRWPGTMLSLRVFIVHLFKTNSSQARYPPGSIIVDQVHNETRNDSFLATAWNAARGDG